MTTVEISRDLGKTTSHNGQGYGSDIQALARNAKLEPYSASKMDLIKQGFRIRPANMDDLDRTIELLDLCAINIIGKPDTLRSDQKNEWNLPDFNIDKSTQLVIAPAGQIVGYVELWDTESPPVSIWTFARVHPDYEGLGIGSYLMDWAEWRALKAIDRVPNYAQMAIHAGVYSNHQHSIDFMRDRPMDLVRHFWRMGINLDERPPQPAWSEGISLQTFADRKDLAAVVHAMRDSFQDHWGMVEQPFEEELDQWGHFISGDKHFDPSLWFLAMDGDVIAGLSLCRMNSTEGPENGHVNVLGVRRQWRRKGIGLALLHHSFNELLDRGKKGVDLGVDAANLTGATRLYERAGMKAIRQFDIYEKILRQGVDISTQQLQTESETETN